MAVRLLPAPPSEVNRGGVMDLRVKGAWSMMRIAACLACSAAPVVAQTASTDKPTIEIYGFGQADAIVDMKQNDPNWFDVNRPTKLPQVEDQFGRDGHFYLSARQSRFGAKG